MGWPLPDLPLRRHASYKTRFCGRPWAPRTGSDGASIGSDPVLNLIAGDYTLVIFGSTDHTGSYSFRLSDLASAAPITPGTVVSGALTAPNATNLYQFNGTAGDQFYFDALSQTGSNTYWTLIDPYGQKLWSSPLGSGPGVLPSTGTYTLLIEGYISNTSAVSYSFNVQKVTNTTAALALSSQVNGVITQAGQQNLYTFSLANASQLYFDSLTADSSLNWTLSGPRGTEVSSRSFTSSDSLSIGPDPVLNLIAGNYTLTVSSTADHTASYAFRLSNLASATAITPGTAVADTLTPGTATNFYQFNANAGDLYYFDRLTATSTNVWWRLIDPYGQQVWANSFGSSVGTQPLASTGTYTLLVEGYVFNTTPVSYSFNAQNVINTKAALPLGTQVNSAITQAGQQNLFTFSLANSSLLYFDSLTNDGNLNWTLSGPRGAEVNGRSFTGSDASSISNPVLNLLAGNYTLTVAATSDHTASYSFRLSDFASATSITLGNPIQGTLSSGTNTDLYKFTAVAGDQIALNRAALNGGSPYWRLIDPYGVVTYAGSFGNSGTLTLPLAGTYTLLFEGQISANGATDYTFNVSSVGHVNIAPPTGTTLALGALTSGSISTAGQQNSYVFTISNPINLYFDSLSNNGSLLWSLIAPDATIVSNRAFTFSDSGNIGSSSPILNLVAPGTYQLVVQGSGSATGSYSFRLSDLASATTITPGTTVSATLSSGNATNLYQFTANPGDSYYFDAISFSTGSLYWRLLDQYGRQVWFQNYSSVPTQVLSVGGKYTLLVEGYISNSSPVNYSFNAQNVTNTTAALNLGSSVNGAITQAGQQNLYTFTLANASQLYFDSLTNDGSLNWTLSGPRGTEVTSRNFTATDSFNFSSDPVLNLIAGNYTLTVSGNADHTASYSFRLANLASASAITPGTVVSDTLNPGTATNLYQFNAIAGDLYFFDRLSATSGNVWWRLIDPYGQQVWSNNFGNGSIGTQALASTGIYTLLVEGYIQNTAAVSYSFNAQKVTNTTATLTLGTQVNSAITQAGQQNLYTFNVANPSQLYFDSLTNDGSLIWTLTGPRGTEINNRSFVNSDGFNLNQQGYLPVLNLIAGNYTLSVAGVSDHTASYSFRVSDLASATQIAPGTPISGTLSPGNSTNLYKFNATVGDLFYFDEQSVSGAGPNYWRLIDPYGRQVWFQSFADVPTQALAFTGTYTLLVEGNVANTSPGNYTFNVQKVTNTTAGLTVGNQVNGAITQAGQQNLYTFNLASPSQLYFDSLTNDSSLSWTLTGPRGIEVNSRNFVYSDGYYANTNQQGYLPVLNLIAGNYTLAVSGTFGHTASYSFRLSDMASATQITPGTLVSGTLSPGNSTNLYKFNANAGDPFYFDEQSLSGSTTSNYWRLIDPYGRQVWFQYPFADVPKQALAFTGTYTLLVEGDVANNSPVNYRFNVDFVPLTTPIQITGFGLQPAPDLVANNLAVTSNGAIQSGGQVTVSWTDANIGDQATSASWTDQVLVRNASNQIIASVTVPYDQTVSGALAAGGTSQRQATLRLPDGPGGTGTLTVSVTVDALNNIAEQSASGQAELNNTSSTTVTSTLAAYADLQVTGLTIAPTDGWTPGSTVTVNWNTVNAGNAATQGSWNELVSVRDLTTGATLLLATVPYDATTSNLITNGDFETPAMAGNGDAYSTDASFSLPGWSYPTSNNSFILESGNGNSVANPNGVPRYETGRQAVLLTTGRAPTTRHCLRPLILCLAISTL
jgi:hypothetical protein